MKVYRLLLLLYPRAFRDRFAIGMCAAFAEELKQRPRLTSKAGLWVVTLSHVMIGSVMEHAAQLSRRHSKRGDVPRHRMGDFALDARAALRGIRFNPGLSLIVIVTLGVGIGASTAIFTVLNTLALRPLPFADGERLLRLRDTVDRPDQATWWYNSSPRSFLYVKERASSFSSVAGADYRRFNVTGDGLPETVVGTAVSDGWLETLGVAPALGRGFSLEEQALGAGSPSVLIAHGLWTRRFGRDSTILGRDLTLNGTTYTVIGVLPRGFNFPYASQVWVMESFGPGDVGSGPYVVARLGDGVSLRAARNELETLSRAAQQAYPDSHRGIRFTAISLRQDLVGNRADVGAVLLGAVGVLLFIACGNVANLLMIRATARRREFAVRTALGATRARLARQLLTEAAVLVALGWGFGLVLAVLLTDTMAVLSLPDSYGLGEFFGALHVDHRVLGFSLAASGLTAALAGVLPAVRASRTDIRPAITEGHALDGRANQPLVLGVVVGEVALAFVLLTGAGAVIDDLHRVEKTDFGFEAVDPVVVPLAISPFRYPEPEDRVRLARAIEEHIRALPGVLSAGMTQHTPVSLGDWTLAMTVEGGHESTPDNRLLANVRMVTPRYLDAIGAALVRGRHFLSEDSDGGRNVVIVSETMAQQHWPGQNPVGRRVKSGPIDNANPWLTVVGVVRDVKEEWNGVDATWYLPYRGDAASQMEMVVHYGVTLSSVADVIPRAVAEVDPEQPVGEIRSLAGLVDESFASERFGTLLAGLFAAFGLLLAAMGVYGVLSFAVRRRVREIGLRMALGSSVHQILRTVVRMGVMLLGVGLVVGMIGFRLLGRLPAIQWADGDVNQFRLLADGIALDWPRAGAALLVLTAVTLFASYLPARRAVRVNPVVALRDG